MNKKEFNYDYVLKEIRHQFQLIGQWAGRQEYELAAKNAIMANTLIELLEAHSCGSHGGFDKGQQKHIGFSNPYEYVHNDLYNRYEWINVKYNK